MSNWIQYLPYMKNVFEILVVGLTIITTLFCIVTIRNLWKKSHLIMSWKHNRIAGFPLGAGALLIIASVVLVIGMTFRTGADLWMLVAYGWSTVCWFVAGYLTSRYYITDGGIIQDVNDDSRFLEWDRIRDFVVREKKGRYVSFTFFYLTNQYHKPAVLKRVEIKVPDNQVTLFQNILDLKLEKNSGAPLILEQRFELPL